MLISIEKYSIKNSVRLAEQIIYFEVILAHNYVMHLFDPNGPVCVYCVIYLVKIAVSAGILQDIAVLENLSCGGAIAHLWLKAK